MSLRLKCISLAVLLFIPDALAISAEPDLKAGVRLLPGGARLQGWAAPDVADWNNDGLNDVVVGHFSGALFVYLNRGVTSSGIEFEKVNVNRQDSLTNAGNPIWAWRFNKANCVCPGPGRISPRVLDWDEDGKKDLIVGDGRGAQTRVWRNIGTDSAPVFSTHHMEYLPSDGGIRPYHETVQPFVADWNGDGHKDLIMGRNRGVYFYLNAGTDEAPDFEFERSRLGTKIRNVFPTERLSPVFRDWDGDGVQDLIVGSQSGKVLFARNVGSKTQPAFSEYSAVRAGNKSVDVESEARIAIADLDGDGRVDLLVGDGTGLVRFYQSRNPDIVARSKSVRLENGESTTIELVGTDDAARRLKFHVLTKPVHGTLTGTAPNLTYEPEKEYVGPDHFTFKVASGELESPLATVTIDVQASDKSPTIETQPLDALVAVGQPASFGVVASGTPPFSYQWKAGGKVIAGATSPNYAIRKTAAVDDGTISVTVTNSVGSVSSRVAALQVKPLPGPNDDVPIVDIRYTSPVIEPATPGVLTINRTGNTSQAVTVKLTSRRGHNPIIADIHYVPVPESVTLEPGQTSADIRVTPIDDTLVNGTQKLTFLIVPNPAYRIAPRASSANMTFLDDDCPHVGISVTKNAESEKGGVRSFLVTAEPPPRRDTTIAYSIGGTAIGGVDYKSLPGTVTIPAGKNSATIVVKPYSQTPAPDKRTPTAKTVALTLLDQPFTYFEFYSYLTQGQPRRATLQLAPSASSPLPPKPAQSVPRTSDQVAVEKLRREVSELGWIVFTARSAGPNSDLDLFLIRPDGSHLRNITETPELDEHSARVAPDGKRLLYRRSIKKSANRPGNRLPQDVGNVALRTWPATGTLVIANVDGSNPTPMGSDGELAWASWGPKGKRISCLERVEPKNAGTEASKKKSGRQRVSFQIVIRDADSMKVLKTIPSAGIDGHTVWSPDGRRICGPANILPGKGISGKGNEYPIGIGKMVSLDIESGKRTAMARFPDWSPVWTTDSNGDWFQGGAPFVLHSANNYGICPAYYPMLWRSGLQEKPSALIFGEFKKHVWGGCTSPDDTYAVFVIGSDAAPLHGQMAIIRLSDAPIARGRSNLFHEVLADFFPNVKKGPVLDLTDTPEGFQPHWFHSTALPLP